jgi:hypothetical protein
MAKKIDEKEYKSRALAELTGHIGAINAIGMAELYEAVTGEVWSHRINDTRVIRKIITALRNDGIRVCSSASRNGGGYYLAAAGSELADYTRKNKLRALKLLAMNARIMKTNLPNYLGQIRLELEEADGQNAA